LEAHGNRFSRVDERYIQYTENNVAVSATTVKISKEASRKLEALQARLRLRSGKRPTKQAILEDLVDRAMRDPEPMILLRPPRTPLPAKVRAMIRKYPIDWGVETSEEDIDELLYGGEG
jgi:hypothetical protein